MNKRFRFHLCVACMLAMAVGGCSVKMPEHVIPESEMENLLYDYHVAKSMGDNLHYGENYKKVLYTDAVFKKYGTTQAIFDSSLVWYARNTETLSKIYERVKIRLKAEQDLVNDLIAKRDKKPKMTQAGDSIDVWPWQRMMRFTGKPMNNQYVFTLPTDSNYKDRDTLVWNVHYRFLKPQLPDSISKATMAMQLIYEKDTLNEWKWIQESGMHQIRLHADTLGRLKEIKGFIFYPVPEKLKAGALLIDQLSMMRYHCTDTLSFATRDSLNKAARLQADSLQQVKKQLKADSIQTASKKEEKENAKRLTPDEMNRRRTAGPREKKPEQLDVERHIQEERMEQQRERQLNQRRRHQQRAQ